ncbi:NAC domain-containing protein [Artemisia annua]|uniref:NAC domain-containing protein n=1 Tax=Artemisia annua TaxID=35608 RepID=A0A2U1LBF0_ARTAN|nr:NAC domain-containing protein [Artemisia annua]
MNPAAHLNIITNSFNDDFFKAVESYVKSFPLEYQLKAREACLDCFPWGSRSQPTDEQLVTYLLSMKINNEKTPKNKIPSFDIYQNHPENIIENYPIGEADHREWYFFTPRYRKHVHGSTIDRKAGSGYWKTTIAEKDICKNNGTRIGTKRSLAYYEGNPQKAIRTKWIMQEYVGVLDQAKLIEDDRMKGGTFSSLKSTSVVVKSFNGNMSSSYLSVAKTFGVKK